MASERSRTHQAQREKWKFSAEKLLFILDII